jgi:hypothetical protein
VRGHDVLIPYCFHPFPLKDRTIRPFHHTLTSSSAKSASLS